MARGRTACRVRARGRTLTIDLVVGVDTDGFDLQPDTTFTANVGGAVTASDNGGATSVAGGPASVAGTVTADVTGVASPTTADRVRIGATLPTSSMTLGGDRRHVARRRPR